MSKICKLILFFLVFLANASGQEKAKTSVETINEFWNLVLTGKIEDALTFCDAKRFDNLGLAKAELELIKIKEAKIINVSSENLSENAVVLHVNVKDKSGNQYVYSFYVYKKTDTEEWKIVDFFRRTSTPNKIILPKLLDNPINFVVDCPRCT